MRVAHIITRLIVGGAQENTLLTVEDQSRDYGDEVSLITGPAEGPEGSLMERARRGAFDLREMPEMVRQVSPLTDWRCAGRLTELLRKIKPEIVHTHSSKAGILGRMAAARLGIPAVHTIHGASFHYGQSRLLQWAYIRAEKWGAKRTAKFISVADDMTAEYVRAGIAEPERFVTIYSGFEIEPFLNPPRRRSEVRRELGVGEDEIVIGKIARLFHLKGHEFLLAAAQRILAAVPRAKFLLVGDGILREQITKQITEMGIAERFVFTGLVPPERIPELIGAMDVVVHTSQWEGLARVLPQALIGGKPVVAYDVGGAREVVLPGKTGHLLPINSVDELAESVIVLCKNPGEREAMGRAGRELCRERFCHHHMTREIREVYRKVLAERRK